MRPRPNKIKRTKNASDMSVGYHRRGAGYQPPFSLPQAVKRFGLAAHARIVRVKQRLSDERCRAALTQDLNLSF